MSCTNSGSVPGALSLSRICGRLWRLSRSSQHMWRSQVSMLLTISVSKMQFDLLVGCHNFFFKLNDLKLFGKITVPARQLCIQIPLLAFLLHNFHACNTIAKTLPLSAIGQTNSSRQARNWHVSLSNRQSNVWNTYTCILNLFAYWKDWSVLF